MVKFRLVGIMGSMLIVGTLALTAALPAVAHGGRVFGALLDTNTQPTNSSPAHTCDNAGQSCTWIMVDAFRRPGTRLHWSQAPRNGVIKKIRVIAGEAGAFRLQIAKVRPGAGGDLRKSKAKIVRNGPVIHVKGQPDGDAPYLIEAFKVNVRVNKGEYLAIKARKVSILRCTSGGPEILQYQPPLPVGGPWRNVNDKTDGCNMLLTAILR